MSKKVFVVAERDYEYCPPIGVFSTKEKAEKYLAQLDPKSKQHWDIVEVNFDPRTGKGRGYWSAHCSSLGDPKKAYTSYTAPELGSDKDVPMPKDTRTEDKRSADPSMDRLFPASARIQKLHQINYCAHARTKAGAIKALTDLVALG